MVADTLALARAMLGTLPRVPLPNVSMTLRLSSLAFAFALGLPLLLLALPAQAQLTGAVTINVVQEQSLPRLDSGGGSVSKRPLTQEPEGVSLQDCLDGQQIAFPLQLAGYAPQSTIEVWAGLSGADCGMQANRTSGTQVCWKVHPGIPLEPNPRPSISVRKIMSGALDPKAVVSDDASICGKVDLTTISLQFLYFAPGQLATPAQKKDIQIRVDTVGPAAPGDVSVLPGNTRVIISFGGLGEGGLTQFTGVRAYCDTSQRSGTTTTTPDKTVQVCNEASTGVDASDDSGDADAAVPAPVGDCEDVFVEGGTTTTGAGACSSSNFVPTDGGKITPDEAFNSRYQCGSLTGNTGSGLKAESLGGAPLENFKEYAIALAAIDQFGNVGPLSAVFCETPEPTTDFWENYKNAGGEAGGGLCSVEGVGLPVGGLAITSFFGIAAIGMTRRRWQSRKAKEKDKEKRSSR
jgi:hypothetical protein